MIDFGFMALHVCFLQGKLSLRHGIRLPEWFSVCDDYRGLGVWAAEPLAAAAVTSSSVRSSVGFADTLLSNVGFGELSVRSY